MVYSMRAPIHPLSLFPRIVTISVAPKFSIATRPMSNAMAEEPPRHPQKTILPEMLEDLDQAGFKITGKLKALVLSGIEDGLLRFRDWGDPFYDATCLACSTVYEN